MSDGPPARAPAQTPPKRANTARSANSPRRADAAPGANAARGAEAPRRADARRTADAPRRADAARSADAPRRADARRNIAAILDAALDCLVRDPQASIADIAAAAGVGRITLYGHFPSRSELIDATFAHALEQADQVLAAVDLSGDPRQALARLIASSWQIVDRFRGALAAAQRELPPERIRAHHGQPMNRVEDLLTRGQQAGVFRTDLPLDWLVALFHTVMHGAAAEITAGRLPAAEAPHTITATLLAAYTPPGAPSPA